MLLNKQSPLITAGFCVHTNNQKILSLPCPSTD
nr:MAG TPA: hypothetical protein [Caudoviricetes sp.]